MCAGGDPAAEKAALKMYFMLYKETVADQRQALVKMDSEMQQWFNAEPDAADHALTASDIASYVNGVDVVPMTLPNGAVIWIDKVAYESALRVHEGATLWSQVYNDEVRNDHAAFWLEVMYLAVTPNA